MLLYLSSSVLKNSLSGFSSGGSVWHTSAYLKLHCSMKTAQLRDILRGFAAFASTHSELIFVTAMLVLSAPGASRCTLNGTLVPTERTPSPVSGI